MQICIQEAVEKLLNFISMIKTLRYLIANRFIVYRIEEMYLLSK